MQVRLQAVGTWERGHLKEPYQMISIWRIITYWNQLHLKILIGFPRAHSSFKDRKQTDRLKIDRHTFIPAHDSSIVVTWPVGPTRRPTRAGGSLYAS